MTKLDRLGWADGSSFKAYGVIVGLRVNDPAILKDVSERLPPGSQIVTRKVVDHLYSLIGNPAGSNGKVRRLNLAYSNLEQVARIRDFRDFLNAFESHVQLSVAENSTRYVFVHAGVVGWKGRAIIIPGRSHSGKTTLVKQLIQAGATYYSDEYAVLDSRGRVHPYARMLGLRDQNDATSKRVRAEELGATTGTKPLRIGIVLSTKFHAGARWRPRRISRGQAMLEILANTVSARTQPEVALPVLRRALAEARALKGRRGEAAEVAHSLLDLS
jgi:hypothetical protein